MLKLSLVLFVGLLGSPSVFAMGQAPWKDAADGALPAPYVEALRPYVGTYRGSIARTGIIRLDRARGKLELALDGNHPTLTFVSKKGHDITGTEAHCTTEIGKLSSYAIRDDGHGTLTLSFELSAGTCPAWPTWTNPATTTPAAKVTDHLFISLYPVNSGGKLDAELNDPYTYGGGDRSGTFKRK